MKLTLHDVLEIHRVTCVEQGCRPSEITGDVARLAAEQVSESDSELGAWLADRAEEMDSPVDLSSIAASLRQRGVR